MYYYYYYDIIIIILVKSFVFFLIAIQGIFLIIIWNVSSFQFIS